jgi:hypothetical protein
MTLCGSRHASQRRVSTHGLVRCRLCHPPASPSLVDEEATRLLLAETAVVIDNVDTEGAPPNRLQEARARCVAGRIGNSIYDENGQWLCWADEWDALGRDGE